MVNDLTDASIAFERRGVPSTQTALGRPFDAREQNRPHLSDARSQSLD